MSCFSSDSVIELRVVIDALIVRYTHAMTFCLFPVQVQIHLSYQRLNALPHITQVEDVVTDPIIPSLYHYGRKELARE